MGKTIRELYLVCRERGIPVDAKTAAIAIQAAGDYSSIRTKYSESIAAAVSNYLGGGNLVGSRGAFKRATATAFVDGFETGYVETAGGEYDPEKEDSAWLASRLDQELAYVDALFVQLKEMRKDKENPLTDADISAYAAAKATMYCRTLDAIYSQGKLRGAKNVMLTFDGEDGQESCPECQQYKGQRHRAKWWVSRDLVPGPGNENYSCNGYNCKHYLKDDKGNMWAGSQE